jgi:adenosylhomocysteine nucleosidase
MVIVRTWLLIAAERREFDGLLKRFRERSGGVKRLDWPGVRFAAEATWNGDQWWLVANGPGPELVNRALVDRKDVNAIVSTGFCGGLDPALKVGEIVVSGEMKIASPHPAIHGNVFTSREVAVTRDAKLRLRAQTGAVAVDMEAEAVQSKAKEWGVPFGCVKVVSDTAHEDMPLDFNQYRSPSGDFLRTRIALAAMAHPFSVLPRLTELDRNCGRASDSLGDFFANCKF